MYTNFCWNWFIFDRHRAKICLHVFLWPGVQRQCNVRGYHDRWLCQCLRIICSPLAYQTSTLTTCVLNSTRNFPAGTPTTWSNLHDRRPCWRYSGHTSCTRSRRRCTPRSCSCSRHNYWSTGRCHGHKWWTSHHCDTQMHLLHYLNSQTRVTCSRTPRLTRRTGCIRRSTT